MRSLQTWEGSSGLGWQTRSHLVQRAENSPREGERGTGRKTGVRCEVRAGEEGVRSHWMKSRSSGGGDALVMRRARSEEVML